LYPEISTKLPVDFFKNFCYNIFTRKGKRKTKKEKNFKKPLDKPKSLWYNKDKIKEGQQNRNRVVGRAKRLLIT